jgi:hypothetical protein
VAFVILVLKNAVEYPLKVYDTLQGENYCSPLPFKRPLFLSPRRHISGFPAPVVLLDEDLRGEQRLANCRVTLRCPIQTLCAGMMRFLMRA